MTIKSSAIHACKDAETQFEKWTRLDSRVQFDHVVEEGIEFLNTRSVPQAGQSCVSLETLIEGKKDKQRRKVSREEENYA
jgi:hypothetical protein